MIKPITSYGLTLSLIIANLQVPLFLHTCQSAGVTTASAYVIENCCDAAGENEAVMEMDCCSLELKNLTADITSDLNKSVDVSLPSALAAPSLLPSWFPAVRTAMETEAIRPPPERFYNLSLLHFIRVLRI